MSNDVVQEIFNNPEAAVESVKSRRGRPKKSQEHDDAEGPGEGEVISAISVADLSTAGNVELVDDIIETNPELEEFRESVKNQIKTLKDSFWYVAEAFVRIRDEKLYKTWGYRNLENYLEQECEYSRSSAFLLMKTYTYFKTELKDRLSGNPGAYEELLATVKEFGWAKASKLAQEQVVTVDTVKEINEAIKTLTVSELEAKLKKMMSDLPDDVQEDLKESNDTKTVKKNFQLTLYELDVVEAALNKAKSIIKEGTKDSKALAFICGEFDSSNDAAKGDATGIADYLYKVERLLGVDLLAVKQNGVKILYGHSVIERLAEDDEPLDSEEDSEEDVAEDNQGG